MIPSTLRDIYTTSIDNYACRDAFSLFKVETVTYAEFARRVETVREILLRAGLKKGDKVAL